MNIEDRSVVERDPDSSELSGQGGRKTSGELHVAASAKHCHRRPLGERGLEPRDPSTFLIDAHPERQPHREALHVDRHLGHLLRRLDVAREQDHAPE